MIKINNEQNLVAVSKEELDQMVLIYNYMLLKEGIFDQAETSVTFVDNEAITELNLEYRFIDQATDVLSFPMYERRELETLSADSEIDTLLLGDIIISLEQAKKQALEYEHSFTRELMYLFVHGMLHLLGFDHLEQDEKKEMRSREEEILEHFGITR